MVAPTIVGDYWIEAAGAGLRGHAYAASNFPAPGGDFHELIMGAFITEVPGAPTHLFATPSDAQVVLAWDAPMGSIVDYYVVYQDGSPLPAHPTTTGATITGLTNGQSYSFTVAAHNAAGLGDRSGAVASTPNNIVPNAPTGLAAITGNAQVALNWTAPADDGGSTIIDYRVYRSNAEEGLYSLIVSPSGTAYLDTGLINGQKYWYKVSAVNINGEGLKSAPINATPTLAPTVPGVITNGSATPGNAQVVLTWSAPISDGGSPITGYRLYRSTTAEGVYVLIASPSEPGFTDLGLSNGQIYWYKGSAVNAIGEGSNSTANNVTPYTEPDAPSGLTAIAGNAQVALNWTAPANNGGRAIDYYVIYQNGTALPDRPINVMTVINGLSNGHSYSFTVSAHNRAGNGTQSSSVTATPTVTVPSTPQNVAAASGPGKVTISWQAPASNGGSAITEYKVYRNLAGGAQNIANVSGSTLNCVDTTGTVGTTYTYYVVAVNAIGAGANSAPASAAPQSAAADNTMLYVGIGIAVIAVIAIVVVLMRRKK